MWKLWLRLRHSQTSWNQWSVFVCMVSTLYASRKASSANLGKLQCVETRCIHISIYNSPNLGNYPYKNDWTFFSLADMQYINTWCSTNDIRTKSAIFLIHGNIVLQIVHTCFEHLVWSKIGRWKSSGGLCRLFWHWTRMWRHSQAEYWTDETLLDHHE